MSRIGYHLPNRPPLDVFDPIISPQVSDIISGEIVLPIGRSAGDETNKAGGKFIRCNENGGGLLYYDKGRLTLEEYTVIYSEAVTTKGSIEFTEFTPLLQIHITNGVVGNFRLQDSTWVITVHQILSTGVSYFPIMAKKFYYNVFPNVGPQTIIYRAIY